MVSILKKYGWHEWLAKTNFSFLVGASHPTDMIKRSLDLGYSSIAINDFDGVYGLARSYLSLKKFNSRANSSLKLQYGAEIHFSKDHDDPVFLQDTLVLLVSSWKGYYNLCNILTFCHKDGKSYGHISLRDLLLHNLEGIIAIAPMRGLIRRKLKGKKSLLLERFSLLKEALPSRFYLAVSRHLHRSEDYWIKPTLELANTLDLPIILSQDAFFHQAEEKSMSDLLNVIRSNKSMEQAVNQMFCNCERHLHSLSELEQRFAVFDFFEDSLKVSAQLAEQCSFSFSELRYYYPKEMIPSGFTSYDYLEHLVWQEASSRYKSGIPSHIISLLNKELKLIKLLKFADYFLTVWDIVRFARSKGILCQGRGSAANSSICYILEITSVDPNKFNLLFERFISMERGDPPDIDVDFEHERREEVIQYIYERFGRDRAAMVANVITFRAKGALRAVGKALGVKESTLTVVTKTLSSRYFRKSGATDGLSYFRESLVKNTPEYKEMAQIPWTIWGEMAEKLRGFPRHLGIHSGGFVLSDRSLGWLSATEPATMEGRTVVQWCKEDIEGLGFFKIDVLSLGMLTAIRKAFHLVEKCYGRKLSLYGFVEDDKQTYEMIQKANTVGVFQIESRAQMSMLPRLRPKCFYDLVIEIAIIRPGPIQGGVIHPYLQRRNGEVPVDYPDERLKEILERTLGIAIFQEQAMRIAITVGGFTGGEANELRKSIGAWSIKSDKELGPWLEKLAEGMRKNGLKEEFVQSTVAQMKGFSDYGFPESHAVSFAHLAYASCYLKCHYPAAFFCSVLNSQPMGFYSPHALIEAAKRDKVVIKPISISYSFWDHTLEKPLPEENSKKYVLRLGFRLIHGIRRSGVEKILLARKFLEGSFSSMEHFCQNVSLYRHDFTALAFADLFRELSLSRKEALWFAEKAPICDFLEDVEESVSFSNESDQERVEKDFAAFGTSLYCHPAKLVKRSWQYEIPLKAITISEEIIKKSRGANIYIFGMVLVRQAPPSAKGMVFLTLEDEKGFINLAMAPPVYKKYHQLVDGRSFILARAKVQKNNESHSLLVINVYAPKESSAKVYDLEDLKEISPERKPLLPTRDYK